LNLFPANTGSSVPVNSSQVLVVDDEAGMRTALEISFLRNGWLVDTANGMTEAMAKFRQKNHPLIVTDIRMPDGDGFRVMQQARRVSPQTAVILLTGFGNVPEAVIAMQGGACDYIRKPFTPDQVKEHVIPLLEDKQ
jgi:DNA-binding NtrC family response regulator